MPAFFCPRTGYSQALVTSMEESEDIATEDVSHILHPGYASAVRLYRPMGHVKGGVHDRHFVLLRRVLKQQESLKCSFETKNEFTVK